MESDLIKREIGFAIIFLTVIGLLLFLPTTHATDVISGSGHTTGVNEGYYTHYSFENYCPMCHHHGCLERGLKRNDEISCYRCGADYSFSGKEKMYKPRAWLTPYYPEPGPVSAENATSANIAPVQPTPLQIAHQVFRNNSIL